MRSRWGAALRIARRDAARHRGRSALIVVMVMFPVMLSVGLATVLATVDITPAEDVPRLMGRSQAVVTPFASGSIEQSPDGTAISSADAGGPPADDVARVDLRRLLGTGLVPVRSADVRLPDLDTIGSVLSVDLADPVTRGLVGLDEGRLPRSVGEAVVTRAAARAGAPLGSDLRIGDTRARVVGVGDVADRDGAQAVAVVLPGTRIGVPVDPPSTSYLVDRSQAVTWSDVRVLNDAGFLVLSRAVLADPPDVDGLGSAANASDLAISALVVACVVIEVALVAGPAFAVGVRTQRRQLALVGAGGGGPGDLVRIVLGGAVVLGGVAAVLGAVLGVVLSPVALLVLRALSGGRTGPFDVTWWAVVGAAALGLLAAVVAAVAPARQAGRRDLVAALGDRPDPPRPAWGWPLLGAGLVAVGLGGVSLSATRWVPEILVGFATVVLVIGVVLLVPLLLGGLGRQSGRLPLALRWAVRDSARQRGRSAPAIAAVMAVVAGICALAIGSASDFRQSDRDYVPSAAPGQARVDASTGDGTVFDGRRLVAEARRTVPDHPLATVSVVGADLAEGGGWTVRRVESSVDAPAEGTISGLAYASAGGVVVADADDLDALGIEAGAATRRALDEGRAVAARAVVGSARTVTIEPFDSGRPATFPVSAAGLGWAGDGRTVPAADVVVPPVLAERLRLPTAVASYVTDARSGRVSPVEAEALERAQVDAGVPEDWASIYVERGFTETYTFQFLALAGAGGLLVLVAVLTATGLTLADARSDLSTLSAVGAAPATRRRVAASAALVVGVVGAVLGLVVGVAPGLAAATFLTTNAGPAPVYAVPWDVLAIVAVGVPALAAAVAALSVRSRTVTTRRLAR